MPAGSSPADPLSELRARFGAGDITAGEAMVIALESRLSDLARRVKGHQRASVSLQTLDLVNEAVLKLMRRPPSLKDDKHFFGYLAETMRCVLVDYHRHRRKRQRAESAFLDGKLRECEEMMCRDLPAGEELLQRLRGVHPLGAQILTLQIYCAQTQPVIAEGLGLSLATVQREARKAREWLRKEAAGD